MTDLTPELHRLLNADKLDYADIAARTGLGGFTHYLGPEYTTRMMMHLSDRCHELTRTLIRGNLMGEPAVVHETLRDQFAECQLSLASAAHRMGIDIDESVRALVMKSLGTSQGASREGGHYG